MDESKLTKSELRENLSSLYQRENPKLWEEGQLKAAKLYTWIELVRVQDVAQESDLEADLRNCKTMTELENFLESKGWLSSVTEATSRDSHVLEYAIAYFEKATNKPLTNTELVGITEAENSF